MSATDPGESPPVRSSAAAALVLGPGAQLAAARVRAGLSLREVAGRSRVNLDILEAIEREDWLALPGRPYVRGFVKLYAREVGLNPALLLDALDRQLHGREQVRLKAQRQAARSARGDRLRRAWAVVAVGVALAALLIAYAAWSVTTADAPPSTPPGAPTP